jgi:hypothetical protein
MEIKVIDGNPYIGFVYAAMGYQFCKFDCFHQQIIGIGGLVVKLAVAICPDQFG